MKVSFVIPAYNVEETIHSCLTSIINQVYESEFEIIVVDNKSTDTTADILKSFKNIICITEETPGRSHARNSGAKMAKGEYVAFIDADVVLDSFWLRDMLTHVTPFIAGIQGNIIPKPSHHSSFLDNFRNYIYELRGTKKNLLKMNIWESPMINSASCMYRRDVFHNVGGFDSNLIRHEDIDLSKRVFLNGYDLLCSPALSYVYYDQNLWNYFKRSFEEGVTKISYHKKWKKFTYKNHPSGALFTSAVIIKNSLFPILKGLITFNIYAIFLGINNMTRFCGMLKGILSKRTISTLTLQTKDARIWDCDRIFMSYQAVESTLKVEE